MVGVIDAQNVNNPIATGINSGTFAWSATGGGAKVSLATGAASFHVEGFVINGSSFSGTPGPITHIQGTLVCNPGANDQSLHNTPAVALDAQGNALFKGSVGTSESSTPAVPAVVGSPLVQSVASRSNPDTRSLEPTRWITSSVSCNVSICFVPNRNSSRNSHAVARSSADNSDRILAEAIVLNCTAASVNAAASINGGDQA